MVSLPLVRLTHIITPAPTHAPRPNTSQRADSAARLGESYRWENGYPAPTTCSTPGSRTLQLMQAQRGGSKLCSGLSSMPRVQGLRYGPKQKGLSLLN